jgi:protein-disulfide isomerase
MKKRSLLLIALLALVALASWAQTDTSALRPPNGAKVALVVFEDMECPDCARAAPLVEEAARTYKIPVVRYDFPLPQHPWAFDASVMAHYFRSQSPALEVEFRAYIFRNQPFLTPQNLRSFAERFARQHNTALPFVIDPQGKFAAAVKADQRLGQRTGIQHTPTLYVVNNRKSGRPFVEVVDRSQLFALIDQMKSEAE